MTGEFPRHVVLVGLMGVGKTTVGRLLAARLGRRFVDSDELIEAATGQTVREIFAAEGEPAFRALETAALLDALGGAEPTVIAAAGGVVLASRNRKALVDSGALVVWLQADVDLLTHRARLGEHRPLLDDDPAGTLARMADEREALYREVAHRSVDTTAQQPAEVVERITAVRGCGSP